MILSRRAALQGAAALSLAAALPARAADAPVLRAGLAKMRLAPPDYPETTVWAYDGVVPGPEIRVAQGARVRRRLVNDLPEPTAAHWHGVRIANAMDGVPYLTQDPVAPGGSFLYDFVAPDAGTYWYHSHARSFEQVARGLYGPLIVTEPEPPEVDAEHVLMLDDWRMTDDAALAGGFGGLHDAAHAGRIGNWITVSGDGGWRRPTRRNDRVRLRLINAATARVFRLRAQGLEGWIVALDGMPLDAPQPLETLTLAPAQRVDVIADVLAGPGEEALLISMERDGDYAVAALASAGQGRARRAAPAALPPNPAPALGDLATARTANLRMEGGAMGRMAGAMLGGAMTEPRLLAQAGKVWAFNGRADMAEAPLIEAARGETVRIVMVNDTAWPHAMHLHGHHFRRVDGAGPGPLRDTLLMERGETATIAFVADNPGDWLLHCHMLAHAASGMMTWLRVA